MLATLANDNSPPPLEQVAKGTTAAIYNTETTGPIDRALRAAPNYSSSEYVDAALESGAMVGEVCHQDLQALSYSDKAFDLVISTDVFEHVPNPFEGHREVLRVLRPGGRHIFTVPFDPNRRDDERRALIRDGRLRLLAPPIYHMDPIHPQGALVYNIFGRSMLTALTSMGFVVRVHSILLPRFGIVGADALVFETIRPL